MKRLLRAGTIIILLASVACNKADTDAMPYAGDFKLVINDTLSYDASQIDFYEFASQLIYLKEGDSFNFLGFGSFKILVDDDEIYSGIMHSAFSSIWPEGAFISCAPTFYEDFIIPINYNKPLNNMEDLDPRFDSKITNALKGQNIYKEGVTIAGFNIGYNYTDNEISVEIKLKNNDVASIMVLDPNKMGVELFHYYTNGLYLKNSENEFFYHGMEVMHPDEIDTWSLDWLTEIKPGETKNFHINYPNFDFLPNGEYETYFTYPCLVYGIKRSDLYQNNGRICLRIPEYNGSITKLE